MKMRRSKVLEVLRAGKVVTVFKTNLADARVVEIVALSGYDCVWVDMEHVPNDLAFLEKAVWAGKAHDVDVMVRVQRGSYSDHVRPLEMDASGIMVPHVMSAADAKQVARMTRFHPVGRRPVDGGNADGGYGAIEFTEYLRQANEQRFVVAQIEDPEPLEELEAIAAVPGIDMLFFGPGDFSHGIGAAGQWAHPRLLDARKRVVEVALANGKYAGTVATPANLDELAALGYRFLTYGADVLALADYARSCLGAYRKQSTTLPKSLYGP